MDRKTVFTKTAKGLMEATGKTSALSRDMRAILKEIDGKATVGEVQTSIGKLTEAKLQEALGILARGDFIREFAQAAPSAARSPGASSPAAPRKNPAEGEMDLDFTVMIPTVSTIAKQAEEAARQKAQAEALQKAKAAAAAAARAKADAEAKAKAKAETEAKARAEAAARVKAETEAKARAEAEARARAEAEARAKREAEERARKEAEDRARKEAEEKARREAEELRAKLEEERKAREEAERKAKEDAERERKEAEEKARREADELRAKLEEERKAREEAEREAKEQAERERKEVEEKARREADELRAKLEQERKAREEAERKAKEQAERERKEAEEKAQREADELRARLEEERRAREEAERKAKKEAERRAKEDAERKAREDAERQAREEAERKAREDAERARRQAEEQARREADELRARLEDERKAREEAERRAQEQAERRAREDAERQAREQAERQRRETEDAARREAEAQARREADERAREQEQERVKAAARARSEAELAQRKAQEEAERRASEDAERRAREQAERGRKEAEEARRRTEEEAERKAQEAVEHERRAADEKSARVTAEQQQTPVKSGPTLEDLVSIETNFDAVLAAGGAAAPGAARSSAAADDKLRKEVEEQARLQAEEQADKEAQELARTEADAKAKRAAQERSRREEERQQASSMDAVAERAALQAREHAEAQALLDAQNAETERHFAEMEKELEAEQAMTGGRIQPAESLEAAGVREQQETRGRVRAAAAARTVEAEHEAEQAPVAYRRSINWGRPVAITLFLLLVLGLIAVHFVSFDAYIPQFEKLASAHMQQPVKIKALHLSLVPQPHWRLDGVAVGAEGQLVVPRINAVAELGSMFSDKKVFTSIELESPVLGEDGLLALLFGKAAGQDLKVAKISVKNGKLDSKTFILPALDAKITFGDDGAWRQIALETPDHKTSLLLKPEGEGATLEVETNAFSLPFHPSFILENLVATGTIRRGELRLSEFKGGIYGGYLSGNADLKWGGGWSLGGEISVRAMEPARFTPALMEEGKLEGKAQYAMRAKSYDELFAAPRLEGSFTVLKGALLGVDLARLLQGGGVGGKTVFTELTGGFIREAGRTQLRQMVLVAGPVSAGGSAEVDAGKRLSGRYTVEIKSPVAKARANLAVAGTLSEPRFSRQ